MTLNNSKAIKSKLQASSHILFLSSHCNQIFYVAFFIFLFFFINVSQAKAVLHIDTS